jgi:hypothetical protein
MHVRTYFLCIWLVLGSALTALAQPDSIWSYSQSFGNNRPSLSSALELSNGDFIVVGSVVGAAPNDHSILVIRMTATGQAVWSRSYGALNYRENGFSIVELPSGSLVVAAGFGYTTMSTTAVMLMGLTAQGDSVWSRMYPGNGQSAAMDIIQCDDGNLAVVGFRMGVNNQHSDIWLLKTTLTGDTLWTRMMGGAETDVGRRIMERPDHGFTLSADMVQEGGTTYDFGLLQTDASGNLFATRFISGDSLERSWGMAVHSSGIYLAGYSMVQQTSTGFAAKVNLNGDTTRWSRVITDGRTSEQLRGICVQANGDVLGAGWSGTDGNTERPWIATLNPANGAIISSWIDSSNSNGRFYGIIAAQNQGCLVFGTRVRNALNEVFVMRIAPRSGVAGIITDAETHQPVAGVYVGTVGSSLSSISRAGGQYWLPLAEGDYQLRVWGACVSADTLDVLHILPDSLLTYNIQAYRPALECDQTSLNVVVLNHRESTTPLYLINHGNGPMAYRLTYECHVPAQPWIRLPQAEGVVPPAETRAIPVTVDADTTDNGVFDYYGTIVVHTSSCPDTVVRIPIMATVLETGDPNRSLPREFALNTPYPNPFNPATTISFAIPHAADVTLTVFDIQGRVVQVLADGRYAAGEYRVQFNGAGLASGFYTARLQTAEFTATRKLLLLK